MEASNRPDNVLSVPRWTVIIHGVQAVFAIIILGLDAYGIRWIAYNALIFSLVAVCRSLRNSRERSILTCPGYLDASFLCLHRWDLTLPP
jgi:hypothetical protein